jgi:hypothetical protein
MVLKTFKAGDFFTTTSDFFSPTSRPNSPTSQEQPQLPIASFCDLVLPKSDPD